MKFRRRNTSRTSVALASRRWFGGALASPQYTIAPHAALRPARAAAITLPAITLLASILLAITLLAMIPLARADLAAAATPGETLRRYLGARLQGDLDTARSLWDRRELQRSLAMGTRYAPIEARFDDYCLWSTAERQAFAGNASFVIAESSLTADTAHFTVRLQGMPTAVAPMRYLVRQEATEWFVSLPLQHDTRAWTRRESRYVTLRAKRLTRTSQEALTSMDTAIDNMLAQLQASPTAQLRLERVKIEYFLCEDNADVLALLGDDARAGYLPGTERVVSTSPFDANSVARVIVNLTARETPPCGSRVLGDGLAAALGGHGPDGADALLARGRAAVGRNPKLLDSPFDDPASFEPISAQTARDPDRVAIAAIVARTLLDQLGPKSYLDLYRSLAGTPLQPATRNATAEARAIESATKMQGDKLRHTLAERAAAMPLAMRGGSETWPDETQTQSPVLRWRDEKEVWSLRAFEIGEDYLFTVSPYAKGLPPWVKRMADSVAVAHGQEKPDLEVAVDPGRPAGDPPYIALVFSPRLEGVPEPYESHLFGEHFIATTYRSQLYALLVNPDFARFYDYRCDVLVAEHNASAPHPSDPVFYDATAGRLSFRLARNSLPRPLVEYTVKCFLYTGE